MAIVTLGCCDRAQLGHFAMERVEVGLRDIQMAFAALIQDALAKIAYIYAFNGMREMTVVAYRQLLIRLGNRRAMHARFKRLVDA